MKAPGNRASAWGQRQPRGMDMTTALAGLARRAAVEVAASFDGEHMFEALLLDDHSLVRWLRHHLSESVWTPLFGCSRDTCRTASSTVRGTELREVVALFRTLNEWYADLRE